MGMKDWKISLLLDCYGGILTAKQRDALELYYDQDLSLGEIAEMVQITRQGVRDAIKRGEQQLLELEAALGLAKRLGEAGELVEAIGDWAGEIHRESTDYKYPLTIQKASKNIVLASEKVQELISGRETEEPEGL